MAGFSLARENVTKQDSAIDGFFYSYGPRAYVLDLATWPRAHGTTASTPAPHARTAARASARACVRPASTQCARARVRTTGTPRTHARGSHARVRVQSYSLYTVGTRVPRVPR